MQMLWLDGKNDTFGLVEMFNWRVFQFDRSIAAEQLHKINSELESDVMIRAIHDVKGIDIGNSLVRYKVGCIIRYKFA